MKHRTALKAGKDAQNLGKLTLVVERSGRVERGAAPRRARRRAEKRVRTHAPPCTDFDREVKTVITSWKSMGGEGKYASRAIANTAHGLQFPCRVIGRQVRQAIEKGVPLARVEELGEVFIRYARQLFAQKHRMFV